MSGSAPDYLTSKFTQRFNISGRETRNSHSLDIPLFKLASGQRSFYHRTVKIWNSCYWFCILVWVSTYTANLAAFLTVKNAAHPIKSLEDIAQTSHQVGVIASTSTQQSFATTQYEPHVKIWQRMKAEKTFVQNTSDGIQQVRERSSFVFINDGPILEYIANHRPCDLTTGM